MLKKLFAAANKPKKPVTKKTLLVFLRWQMLWMGIAFVLAFLDLANIMYFRANSLMLFIFAPLGLTYAAYISIHYDGLELDESDPKSPAA